MVGLPHKLNYGLLRSILLWPSLGSQLLHISQTVFYSIVVFEAIRTISLPDGKECLFNFLNTIFNLLLNLINAGMKTFNHFCFGCCLIDLIFLAFHVRETTSILSYSKGRSLSCHYCGTSWLIAALCSTSKCSRECGLRARGQCNSIMKMGHFSYACFWMKLPFMILAKAPWTIWSYIEVLVSCLDGFGVLWCFGVLPSSVSWMMRWIITGCWKWL